MKSLRNITIAFFLLCTANLGAQDFSFLFKGFPRPEDRKDTITLRFIGDVMLHTKQIETARQKDGSFDFTTFLEGIRPDLENADLAVANMEFTLAGAPYTGYPGFSSPDSYADYAADCGIDVFLTANNHILDKGPKGLSRTLGYYGEMEQSRGILYTGSANPKDSSRNPLYVIVKGAKIAIINFTYGTNCGGETADGAKVFRMDEAKIKSAIQRAKRAYSDLIIVCPHWGTEYDLKHSATQEKWARMIAEAGADVIIGAHPHVVQDKAVISTSDGRCVPVYYSLGNAVSNMSATNTQLELMVTVRLLRNYYGECTLDEVSHDFLWCSRPGYLTSSYKTIKVSDYIGRRSEWKMPYGYDKMISTLKRIEY